MNRWVLRVAAYSGLMTDEYPPFRIDMGGDEPDGSRLAVQPAQSAPPGPPAPVSPSGAGAPPSAPAPTGSPAGSPPGSSTGWGAGRVIALVLGLLALVTSLGLGAAAGGLLYADQTFRDDDGFLTSDVRSLSTDTYALVSDQLELHIDGTVTFLPEGFLGDAKVTASGASDTPVFVGLAATRDVDAYLDGVAHAVVMDLPASDLTGDPSYRTEPGDAPAIEPGAADFWVAQSSGTGDQTIEWSLSEGTWSVVVMNADGSQSVDTDVTAGVTVPALTWSIVVLLGLTLGGLVIATVLLVVALHRPRGAQS
jgi:hypothetical protein